MQFLPLDHGTEHGLDGTDIALIVVGVLVVIGIGVGIWAYLKRRA